MRNKLILFIFALFLISFVSAAPPVQFSSSPNGFDVRTSLPEYLQANTSYIFNVHVYNLSDGMIVTNTSSACYIHLYDSIGTDLFEGKMPFDQHLFPVGEFSITLDKANFTKVGQYAYLVQCNTTHRGGFISGLFDVTYGGTSATMPYIFWYSFSVIFLVFLIVLCMMALDKLPQGNPRDEYGQLIGISHLKYLKLPLFGVIYWLFVATFFIISTVSRYYLSEQLITRVFFALFTIGMKLSIPMMIVIFVYLIIEAFRDKELTNLMKRGLPTNGQ